MLSLAVGHLEQCIVTGKCLLVDWSWPKLLYAGPSWEPNLWTVFFRQPAELAAPRHALLDALQRGHYVETKTHEFIFGNFKGVAQGCGTIDPELASKGRALCNRWLVMLDEFRAKVEQHLAHFLNGGLRWLAVHIRRGDKGLEAMANIELTEKQILSRITAQCAAWHCDGVFLCSDDPELKERLSQMLRVSAGPRGVALRVTSYFATLSAKATRAKQGSHFDESLDKYQKAEDVMVEAMLMARAFHGLLCTFSNVSAFVVYFSPEGYPYQTFWEPCPPRPFLCDIGYFVQK